MAVSNPLFSQLTVLKHVVKSGNMAWNVIPRIASQNKNVFYSTANSNVATTESKPPEKKMSKAMLAYLERAKAHDEFIKKEEKDFKIGKRHLANMMGEDPEHFTQDDIDKSIEYLFPSGLYDKAARPLMKPPDVIFPPKKAAEFNETGRPFHSLFYTTRPNYYKALYDAVEHMQALDALEDSMIRKGISPDPNIQFDSSASEWVSKESLEKILLENVADNDYEYFISTFQRLVDHPYSYQVKDFLMTYRKVRKSLTQSFIIPELNYDSDGRPFITVPDCMRKSARGAVTLRGKGSGKIIVNGEPLHLYFDNPQDREQIIFPLQFTGMMDEVDVEAEVRNGGPTGQSGAIRWGIAWGLRSFVPNDMIEKMRLAGLLTRDWRRRERKKPGQEGARRKFTWKRR